LFSVSRMLVSLSIFLIFVILFFLGVRFGPEM
jgi:hypothetical protein